ncbi:MAG: LCP family protein [Chloroflexi bacterium]|nr:LCP family protein [Chloroflexota bacterium]
MTDLPGVEQRVTFLLLGIDQADSFEGNTDVIMLVSLDPESGSALVLSIPRDLCLDTCDTHSTRVNEIFKRQGMEPLQATLHNITGLPIDYFLLVNFYGVERIIDALGGVNVWSPREFDERFVYLDTDEEIRLVLEPGSNTLNGREAVAYGRSRKYDPGGDFARICRQQQVMRGLREQALSPALIVNIPAVLEELGGAFRTDFPLEQLPALADLALRTPPQRVHSFAVHSRGGELLQWFTGEDGAFLLRPDLVSIRDFVADAFARSLETPTNAAGEPVFIADNCEAYYPS